MYTYQFIKNNNITFDNSNVLVKKYYINHIKFRNEFERKTIIKIGRYNE